MIPPAWTAVWICARDNGHLQATGRDARGRKQHRYHPRWTAARNETKYDQMIEFALALPAIKCSVLPPTVTTLTPDVSAASDT